MNEIPASTKRFSWSINLGQVLQIAAFVISTVGAGIGVYVGVFQTLTQVVLELDNLKRQVVDYQNIRDRSMQNSAAIVELQKLVEEIKKTSAASLEQLVGIRIDLGVLKQTGATERSARQ